MRGNAFSKGAVLATGSLLAVGLLAASATAATSATRLATARQPARRAAAHSGQPTAPTPVQRWLLADRRAQASRAVGGAVTGVARAVNAAPLEGICVTATGPSGSRLGMTRQDGRFLISGLRPGSYSLQYRDCGHPGRFLPQGYGTSSRPVLVGGSGLVQVAPVTLRRQVFPAGQQALGAPSADLAMSLLARVRAAVSASGSVALHASLTPANGGRISGRVTDRHGHPLAGICVETLELNGGGFTDLKTGRRGLYLTAKLPPGRYVAIFFPGCGNSGNWLPQVYKDSDNLAKPTIFRVRAGMTTAHIDAALRPGGEISGTVTNAAGRKLSGICVDALPAHPRGSYVVQPGVSRNGAFHVRSLQTGGYQLFFVPCRANDAYAPVWWKNSATQRRARVIRVTAGRQVSGINQVLQIGGKITGVVTAGSSSGPKLAGICVNVVPVAGGDSYGAAATRPNGTYVIQGLSSGRYRVRFSPGCPDNGNYLPENYPGTVAVTIGRTHAGINGVLPVGARISGVVTDTHGHPIAGICVLVVGGPGYDFGGGTQTRADGSYSVGLLRAGNYVIEFSGGCGNAGSYAPQGYHGTNVNVPQEVPVGPAQQVSGIDAVMQPGATIAGRVTSRSGQAVRGACVFVTTPGFEAFTGPIAIASPASVPPIPAVDFEMTGADGRYRSSNLQPGQYELAFAGCAAKGDLVTQWYARRSGFGPPAIVYAGARHATGGIDVVLQSAGAVSGALKTATGRVVQAACVKITDLNRGVRLPGNEDLAFGGRYEMTGLPPGAYHVSFTGCGGGGYATQWYSRKTGPARAARVIVRAGHTTAGIDSALTIGGSISGRVTSAATHAALGNVCVFAQSVSQPEDSGIGITNRQGHYVVGGLNSGRYDIEFVPCVTASTLAGQVRSSLVTVVAPRQTRAINAALGAGGSIQGRVTAGSPGTPGQALCVDAFSTTGGFSNSAMTDASGSFAIPELPAGQYVVFAGDPACPGGPYDVVPQWYSGKSSRARATRVTVTAGGTTAGVDANLALDGAVTGTVTGPGRVPLSGVCVSAVRAAAGATPVVAVTARGDYAIGQLAPGRYRVEFSSGCGAAGFVTQWWRNAGSAAGAAIITVTAGSTVTGISAALRRLAF